MEQPAVEHGVELSAKRPEFKPAVTPGRRRGAAPGDDLISSLLGVRAEEGAPLDTAEIVNTTVGTLLAGHDTTTALIVNAMFILLSSPERWAAVRERPGTIPGVLEEALRVDSPVPVFIRTAVREVTVGGAAIPEGAILLLAYGSANRDPARFPDPGCYDPSRSPNPHLAFGRGVHTCAGAGLARLRSRIALEALRRLPGLRLRPGQDLRHVPTLIFRSLDRLAVEWDSDDTAVLSPLPPGSARGHAVDGERTPRANL